MAEKESIRTLVLQETKVHPDGVSAGSLAESLGLKRSQVSAVLTQLAAGANPPVERISRGLYALTSKAETPEEAPSEEAPSEEAPKVKEAAVSQPRKRRTTKKATNKRKATTRAKSPAPTKPAPTPTADDLRKAMEPVPPMTMASFIAKHFDLDSSEVDVVIQYFSRFESKIND